MSLVCEGCGGTGLRLPATPSCEIQGPDHPWICVEKCDTCDRFEDDLAGALTKFCVAGWFRCASGGEHVLADSASRRS